MDFNRQLITHFKYEVTRFEILNAESFTELIPMQKLTSTIFLLLFIGLFSCEQAENPNLITFDVYCEMVASDSKPIASNYPMEPQEVDKLWDDLQKIANKHQVKLYREDSFPPTVLYPAEATAGKTLVLIYKGDRLTQYQQWKEDVLTYSGKDSAKLEALARRFGRLLGYSPQSINALLSSNTAYKSLVFSKITEQVTHLYYKDVEAALRFYTTTLGLNKIGDNRIQISKDAFLELHPHNKNHGEGQTKSTAIALLTDQLPEWYQYAQEQNIPIKYTYKPRDGGPHDGFVAIDPEGYLLEIEQFKQHPENELFVAALANAPKIETAVNQLNFYGSITWTYHNDLLKMQQFYEEGLGYRLVADQGWTKIYQTSPTGFIGLVDERRGMEDYADTKAIELEWKVENLTEFDAYAQKFWTSFNYKNQSFQGPEKYIYHIK